MPKNTYKLKELMPKKGYQWQSGPLLCTNKDAFHVKRCMVQAAKVEHFGPRHAHELVAELYRQALKLGNLLVNKDSGVGIREFWDLVKSQCWASHLSNDQILEFTDTVAQARWRCYKLSLEIPDQGPMTRALDAWFEFLESTSGDEFTPFYDEKLEEDEMDPEGEVHDYDVEYDSQQPSSAPQAEAQSAPAAGPPSACFTFSLPLAAPKAPQFPAAKKPSGATAPVVKKLKAEEEEHTTRLAEEEEEDLRHKVTKLRIE